VTVAIIDYGSGNLHSAKKALECAAHQSGFSEKIVLSNDPDVILKASKIILPGVGAFADCLEGIEAIPGLYEALSESVLTKGRPFLGICVGMQLLASRGREHQITKGFGWISGEVIPLAATALKVPHMGWNTLNPTCAHSLFENIPTGDSGYHAYFVHSFHFVPEENKSIIAETAYGETFASVVGRDNIVGTQFHPEKSQKLGLAFLANFLRWRP
jgi:glutamine amidotransferase